MKPSSFDVYVLVALTLVSSATSTSARAKKALAFAEESYEDAGEVMSDLQSPIPQRPVMHEQQQSFLATSSQQFQQQAEASEIVMRFSEAVQKNSQALMALEAEQEKLAQRETSFEHRILAGKSVDTDSGGVWIQIASKGTPCKTFSKGGEGPVTDEDTCRDACVNAEGLYGGDWDKKSTADAEGNAGGKCNCQLKKNNRNKWREICNDKGVGLSLSLLSVLSTLAMLLREF